MENVFKGAQTAHISCFVLVLHLKPFSHDLLLEAPSNCSELPDAWGTHGREEPVFLNKPFYYYYLLLLVVVVLSDKNISAPHPLPAGVCDVRMCVDYFIGASTAGHTGAAPQPEHSSPGGQGCRHVSGRERWSPC